MQPINPDVLARFRAKIDKSGDCWIWTAYVMPCGYGQFSINGKLYLAHRISYEITHGAIPAGYDIDHMCHNRTCVRPDHLRLATRKQNMENLSSPHRDSRSGVRGVFWRPDRNKWQVTVGHKGKTHYVGIYTDREEAEAAAVAKRRELFTHNILDRASEGMIK